MAKKKKILVTGSGGFIFGNFIRQVFYSKQPYTLSSIDRVRESHIIHNIYVNTDHAFYIADVRDTHTLHVIFEKERPDVVIHGAEENAGPDMVSVNVVGTQNVINECARIGARLIYVSTNRVFPDLVNEQANSSLESDRILPTSEFAASKAAGELLVQASRLLNYNIVRLGDNYGPWQSVECFIPSIISSILNGTDINIFRSGYQLRQWTHVYDTCAAIFSVIENGDNQEIYNITSQQEFCNLEVAQIVCNTIEKGHDQIKHVEKDVAMRYAMANDKIKGLGWSPQYKFRDGIAQTCQWYLSNKYVLKM